MSQTDNSSNFYVDEDFDDMYEVDEPSSSDVQQSKVILAFSIILLFTAFGILYLAYDALSQKFEEVERLESNVKLIGEEAIKQAVTDSRIQVEKRLKGLNDELTSLKDSQLTQSSLDALQSRIEVRIKAADDTLLQEISGLREADDTLLQEMNGLKDGLAEGLEEQKKMFAESEKRRATLEEVVVVAKNPDSVTAPTPPNEKGAEALQFDEPPAPEVKIEKPKTVLPGIDSKWYVAQLASTVNLEYLKGVQGAACFSGSQVVHMKNGRYVLIGEAQKTRKLASAPYLTGDKKDCRITPWVRSVSSIRRLSK
jgi:regulator of replication initiation timing